ncbi:MAG: prolipoprotein diacylglyceryl transferase [Fuerstiella sp.]|nr:prolipoprotein diacylglyceryl transferase [Fuerstiella sp.]
MRKVLLRLVYEHFWQVRPVGNELHVGIGWLYVLWMVVAFVCALILWRKTRSISEVCVSLGFWSLIPAGLILTGLTDSEIVQHGIPVFGYGFMMFVGFSAGTLLAVHHAKYIGMDPAVIMDLMMWLLIPGLVGARLFYVCQYPDRIFGLPDRNPLWSLMALWDGGLVFYGAVIGGAFGGWIFCRRRKIRPLLLGDVVAPSLLIGSGFGRIGCFLYGCCYGGACSLPWAVRFPPDSLTYQVQLNTGVIQSGAVSTTSLHPTQIYSSLLAFCLAGFLTWCFRRRKFEGFVVGLTFTMYPINRFLIEFIRNDEQGQLGTSLTISQWISIALFTGGITMLVWLSKTNDSFQVNKRNTQPG